MSSDILDQLGVKSVFTQNAKMKRSSTNGIHLYNFGIPAFRSASGLATCPMAGACAAGCYARSGAYNWSNVAQAFESRLKLTQHVDFVDVMIDQVNRLLKRHKTGQVLIRVHDSGDFYNVEYQLAWYRVAMFFKNKSRLKFYAYTKMISQSKSITWTQPSNFRLIYSFGGKEDALISVDQDFHSKVFESTESLSQASYKDGTHDDTVAALGESKRIGLVYHGAKSYAKTAWNRVS